MLHESRKQLNREHSGSKKSIRISVAWKIPAFEPKRFFKRSCSCIQFCNKGLDLKYCCGNKMTTLMKARQAAEYLNISVRLFYYLVADGKITSYNLSPRSTRFSKTDLDEYIKSCRSTTIKTNAPTVSDSRKLSMGSSGALANSFRKAGVNIKPEHFIKRQVKKTNP